MPENEDWRFLKAQELGLVDMGPIAGRNDARPRVPPARPPSPAATEPPAPPPRAAPPARPAPVAPTAVPPPPEAAVAPPPPVRRAPPPPSSRRLSPTLRAAAMAVALFAAAAGGWLLHAVLGTPDPVMTIAARQAAATAMPGPAAVASPQPPEAPPVPTPVPETASTPTAIAAPAAEPEVAPPVVRPAAVERTVAAPKPEVQASVTRQPATSPPTAQPRELPAADRMQAPVAIETRREASFDCRTASTDVNRMICADARLGALDVAMGDAYRAAVSRGGPEAEYQLDSEQASFLNARAGCQTPGCIARMTRRRLDDLHEY